MLKYLELPNRCFDTVDEMMVRLRSVMRQTEKWHANRIRNAMTHFRATLHSVLVHLSETEVSAK
jgi:hypothetical protein